MRPVVIAFASGAVAVAIVAAVACLAVGAAADAAGWSDFTVGLGPVLLVDFQRSPGSTSTTLGSGIALVALAGGVLNAAVAALLARRLG